MVAARDATASLTAAFGLLEEVGAYDALKREEERLLENGFLTLSLIHI